MSFNLLFLKTYVVNPKPRSLSQSLITCIFYGFSVHMLDHTLNLATVVSWILTLKGSHILISRSYDYVILPGKKDFADVINLQLMRWGQCGILGYPGEYNVITRVFIRGRCQSQRKTDVKMEPDIGVMCFQDGRRGHEPSNTVSF